MDFHLRISTFGREFTISCRVIPPPYNLFIISSPQKLGKEREDQRRSADTHCAADPGGDLIKRPRMHHAPINV